MRRPRRIRLNSAAEYLVDTGCVRVGEAVIELTVAEEELLELLLRDPKVTVSWRRLEAELVRSNESIRAIVRGLRDKLGARAIRTHVGKGLSVQPQFVGTARFALANHPARAIPSRREIA